MQQGTVVHGMLAVIRREVLLLSRKRLAMLNPLFFSFLVALMFPLGLGPEPGKLQMLAPGLVWVIALLSALMTTDGMYKDDFDDGSLALIVLSPQPAYFLQMGRLIAQWLGTGLVISLAAPLVGVMLNLPPSASLTLLASLLLGTVTLVFVGGIGAALTVGLKNSGILLTLIVLPLYVPVLIFGAASVQAAAQSMNALPYLALLAAFMILALTLAPLAIQAALKINLDAS
ncbi:Heme exporter protein B [BD1-7 clade bacterium]|uniref:Heme exporter protein B n=1 Tax=BD1-7 clade bacterium TaxID=2029982 RepID=A0A5S9QUX0_9GAMM|nr:Heme exporter protein B [BD1-7 clade bacterium]